MKDLSASAAAKRTAEQQRPRLAYPIDVLCDDLGVCRATVYNWMKQGRLTGIKLGHKRLFAPEEVARLLEEGARR